jgi:hypothetical protein
LPVCDDLYFKIYKVELRLANGVTLLAKFDGEFASRSTTYDGTGTIRYGVSYRRAVCAAARNFYDNALHDTIRGLACLRANFSPTPSRRPSSSELRLGPSPGPPIAVKKSVAARRPTVA